MRLLKSGACAAFLVLAACPPPTPTGDAYIAPLNGQSAISPEMDLVVHTWSVELPPEYPLPTLMRVVDLETGGLVAGDISKRGNTLRFTPTGGWRPNRRFAWTVNPIEDIPHGPETLVEGNLVGTAVFDTSDTLNILGATSSSPSEICLIMSRPLLNEDGGDVRVTVNDVELDNDTTTFLLTTDAEYNTGFETDPVDAGVHVFCITEIPQERDGEAITVTAGSVVRVWWGEGGPWRQEVQTISVADKLGELRRLGNADDEEQDDTEPDPDPVPADTGGTDPVDTGTSEPEPADTSTGTDPDTGSTDPDTATETDPDTADSGAPE